MRADALATLFERSDSHHCLSLIAAPRSLQLRVAIQVEPVGRGKRGACTDHLCLVQRDVQADGGESRDEVAEERTLAMASPGKTASSERQRLCRQRPGKTSGSGCELGRGCFVFEMFDFRGKSPENVGPALCTQHSEREKKMSEIRTAVKLEPINACTPHPAATSLGSTEEGPILPQTLARSLSPSPLPPQSAMRDRAWHRVARVALRFQPPPSQIAALHPGRGVSRFAILLRTSMPSLDG